MGDKELGETNPDNSMEGIDLSRRDGAITGGKVIFISRAFHQLMNQF